MSFGHELPAKMSVLRILVDVFLGVGDAFSMSRRKEKVLARDPGYVVGLIALAGVWAEIWGINQ